MKNRIRIFLGVLLLPLFLGSCLKDDPGDKTIILFGEEDYIKPFDSVFGMGKSALFQIVDAEGHPMFPVHEGIATPDIRGEFEFADRQLAYAAVLFESPNDKVYFRFGDGATGGSYLHEQHHLIVHCDIKIPGLDYNTSMFRTDTAYVMGSGTGFTVYLERENEVRAPYAGRTVRYKLSQGIAITGERNGGKSDVTNAKIALYNKDIEIKNPEDFTAVEMAPIKAMKGQLFIYRDSDDVSKYGKFINWD